MFDIWFEDASLTVIVILFSILIVFPLQYLLCSKVKSLPVRLIPTACTLFFALVSAILLCLSTGWESMIFIFFLIYAGFLLFIIGLAWGIRAFLTHRKTK